MNRPGDAAKAGKPAPRKSKKLKEKETGPVVQSFPPALGRRPRILILGSMPGQVSLREQQYYAHPQNAFWGIMAELLDGDADWNYRRRIAMLKRGGVALWDVFARCRREGSLDSDIARQSEVANDIPALLRRNPGITIIACNGGKAHQGFMRHILPALRQSKSKNNGEERAASMPQLLRLPSSSPANARLSRSRKLMLWKEALQPWLKSQSPQKGMRSEKS